MNKQHQLLKIKLDARKKSGILRELRLPGRGIDFSSNDYLGLKDNPKLKAEAVSLLVDDNLPIGSGGSRLLSGNSTQIEQLENETAQFFLSEKALFFNSGFDANLGLFSSVPQKDDIILYDDLVHASIRDGIRLSFARSFSFDHNNLEALEKKLLMHEGLRIYVAVESVYSMDGDTAPLRDILKLCLQYGAALIVDEAHATGILGSGGRGLCEQENITDQVFARIFTFGKALGTHGAAVCGSALLQQYLLNFSRSFIYTTALSPFQAGLSLLSLQFLQKYPEMISALWKRINYFDQQIGEAGISKWFITGNSAIKCLLTGDREKSQKIAADLREKGFEVMPVLSPTVAQGSERIRICLHAFNSEKEITNLIYQLKKALA
ncbi:MAG TPA: 8-amino-7-oxononanoate synthase [Sphingobacteriaceae bacterium]|nr:8-amino-7-oxononanoate synthase [Sphingobacteriaceae bacterium]